MPENLLSQTTSTGTSATFLIVYILILLFIGGLVGLIVWIIKKANENKPQVNNYYVGQPPYQKVDQQTFNQQQPKI